MWSKTNESPFGPEYIVGGKVVIKQEDFCLKIWAKRELTDEEILRNFDIWRKGQPQDFERNGQTFHVLAEPEVPA
ncbi:hypothetical protein SBV1_2170004 [Verrucomicrobia bacterium]|nr:hypothetical protein SBV1_2170004 [Verrucomicrobiota bacterium]